MNKSIWNAYYIAKAVKKHFPNGIRAEELVTLIRKAIGVDKRTVDKYREILRTNRFLIEDKNSPVILRANPDLENMTPLSPKRIFESDKNPLED